MKRIVRISTLFLLLALLGSATNVRAGVEPVLRNSLMGDSIRVDSFRIVEDVEYTNTNLGDYNLYKVFNYVTVEINQDQIVSCYLDSFCFSANVEITGWDETGTPHYDTGYFTVCYDQRTGMQYKGIQTKKLEGFYKVKIKVLSVSNTALTDYIRISAEIAIERYKDLDIVSLPDVNSSSYSAPTGDITVNWDAVEGAEEYDLEYTFVDNYNGNVGGTISASSLEVDFKNNASRVTVKGTSYAFSNVFEQGYVVFRVRAAGYTGEDFTWRVTGNWTNQGYTSALSDYSSHEKLGVSALEPEFNWQYVNTFSEGGKRKELISFMDGTFRNRQSVTRITSDETVIIGETMYDHQGRPALQILPVPFDSTRIMYYPNFSIDSLNPTNYTRLHFDTGTCEVISRPLKATSGASKYYSPNNPFLAQSTHWLSDHNPYIPSAEGMPFVRTVYTDDNSGRVALQSGVGPDHAIGSGHESKYFYGTPYQEEIDRLFGNNVGFAKHYQKQMVVDPNGQVSVSYTDLSGKVIATALAGEEPDNVAILTNNDGIREIEVQLIPYEDYSMPDPYTTLLSKKINVAVPAEYRLNYLLNMVSFQDDCMSACYECVYDLTISVKDECGQELLDGDVVTGGIQPFIREIKRVDSSYYSITCAATTVYKSALDALIEDSMRVVLGVGSYTISKQLTVSEKAAQYFAGLYLADTSCVLEEEDFIDYHLSVIDDFGCETTCEECTEMLMDSAGYIATRKEAYENQGYFNEDPVLEYGDDKILEMAVEEYVRKKAICEGICNQTVSPCEYMLVVMEVDVAPGGQYEELKGEVTSHPEYCRYQFCLSHPEYALFEMTMDSITDGTRAMQLGFMNPMETNTDFPVGVHDAFFYGTGYASDLLDELGEVISVPDIYSVYHDLDVWQSAIWISNFVLGSDTSPMYSTYAEAMATNNAFEEGRCGMKDPYLWETFRALYKVARSRALEQILVSACPSMNIPAGKTARFIPLDDVHEQTGSDESELETFTYSHCEAGCDSMSGAWMLLLGPCVTEHVSAGAIRAALINACAAGCGPGSPMGSSDGFQAVLESFGVYVAGSCDPRIISTPGPSGSSEYTSDASDQHCVCEDEDDPCLQMDADPAFQSVIRSLYYSSKEIECDSICYECLDIQNALIPFFEEVGDTLNILDSTANWPLIMAAHLNRTLKVNYDYDTYIDFIRSCANLKGINVDDDSVIRKFQELPEPGVISEEDYLDSINGVIQASLEPFYNPDFRLYSGGILAEVETPVEGIGTTRTYFDGAIPDIQYTAVTCPGYVKVNTCVCSMLDLLMDNPSNSALQDPSDPSWSTKWICDIDPAKIKRILEVCRTAYKSKAGKDISDMDDPGTWDQQAEYNLEDLVNAENLYLPASCVENLDCFSCSGGPPYPAGVTLDPPDPIEYTPYLPCDSLLKFLDSFLKANESRLSKPLSPLEMQEIADSLDSRYSGEPYKRGETDASPADDPEYRKERLIAEVMRCTNDNLVGGCSNVSGTAVSVRSYFSCDETTCYLRNGTSNLVQKWLRKETYLKKDSLPGDGFTSRTNLLWTDEHNLSTYNVTEYISTELYEGSSAFGVDHYFYGPMHGTGPGPKKFWITDGTDSVLLWLAFFAPDKRYSLICNIRGVVSLDPYMAAPCDSTNRYNLEVIVETYDEITGERGMLILPMFGKTDRYELMDTCGVTPVLCGRSSKSGPLIGAPPKCHFDFTALATSFAKRSYQAYTDSVKRGFIHGYKTHCIGEAANSESLTMRFDQQEYHYTLYYYDLAGNLIQTVPPEGVNPLNLFDINQANDFRQGSGSAVFASHDLPTTYMYNSLNELKWQNTPDGGSSDFWYDRLGRLVVSRNAKQKAYSNPTFSYSEYDPLGRIKQVGEVEQEAGDTMSFALAFGDMLDDWLEAGDKSQITTTYYDQKEFTFSYNGFTQNFLRNRVSSTTFTAIENGPYQSAVHYDYDVHGNVGAMVREYPGLDSIYEQYKVIRYEYELVSGNVLKVLYQPDSLDRFFHKYEYDADNRITGAYTSTDQVHWDRDAKYTYYLHGPLARTELGELRVQGMDYAYTLHGWLKGVNSERLRTSHDIGKDGNTSSNNQWVCPDVFGFGLGYYWETNDKDYKAIGNLTASNNFIIDKTSSTLQTQGKSLYNGNIGIMVTAIGKFMEAGGIPFGRAFQYDQLNRIRNSRAYNNVDTTTNNKWKSTGSALSQYATDYTYDANGNILTLLRKGAVSQTNMDNLTYHYYSGTNRLNYVDDAVSAGNYGVDIDDQWTGNYEYDAIGNLVADSSEQIAEITWTVYGKIQSITRTGGSSKPDLQFEYSPDGHRIAKHVMDPTSGFTTSTWYVRDASGNIMATYEKSEYTVLDTSGISLSLLNSLVVTDWGAHVFSRFMEEGVELHTMMSGGQFTSLKSDLTMTSQLETALRMLSPMLILPYESTLMNDVLFDYSSSDFYTAMLAYYGSTTAYGNALRSGCNSALITHLVGTYYFSSNFARTLFTNYPTLGQAVWSNYNAGPYPGASGATIWLHANVSPVSNLYAFIGTTFNHPTVNIVTEFSTVFGTTVLGTAISSFGSLKSCTRTVQGDVTMFGILDLYDRTELWDQMIANSSVSNLADMMISHDPGKFLQAALELNPTRANTIFSGLGPMDAYHVTDYLNAILNYSTFGSSYYQDIVNQLMTLGYVTDGWNYSVSEHHIYGSSRVGVHKTEKVLRTRFDQGDIVVCLDDLEYATLYRGKRNYELNNHLGNVHVIISDKRISICDDMEVESFKSDVLAAMDYYPFGMMMPDRQWYAENDSSTYSFGMNGQMKDNEISGIGNSYSAEYWQYDSRLARRWEIDPKYRKYPHQSPYATFNNSPVYYADPLGAEGDASVDKANRTITVTVNFYYDMSDPNFKRNGITEDVIREGDPYVQKAETSKAAEIGWGAQTWTITDDDGEVWTVNYNVNFIPLENKEAVDNKLKEDPTANALVWELGLHSAGEYNQGTRTMTIGMNKRFDGSTTNHEIGHSIGLPHANYITGDPLFGSSSAKPNPEDKSMTYGIMSYAEKRAIQAYEVRFSVIKSIMLAKSVNSQVVRIHIKGCSDGKPRDPTVLIK